MERWTVRLTKAHDPVRQRLMDRLKSDEQRQRIKALEALDEFDQKKWRRWMKTLPRRARPILTDRPLCETLALARLQEAQVKHQEALRKRDLISYHQLRIGLKRFRYTVENFLPDLYPRWRNDLKYFQDLLGDVNDLQNLWLMLDDPRQAFEDERDAGALAKFRARIAAEQRRRLQIYLQKTRGARSPWKRWQKTLERLVKKQLRRGTKAAA
jgi:CHAD domain-containing protein